MPDNYFDEEEFETKFNGKTLVRILQLTLPHLKWVIGFLVTIAIVVGWMGGALVATANARIAVSFEAFFHALRSAVDLLDVLNGVFKSFMFALIIGMISCHQGLITRGGPRGIGRSVTKAVVNSIVLIVISDYFLTRILLK